MTAAEQAEQTVLAFEVAHQRLIALGLAGIPDREEIVQKARAAYRSSRDAILTAVEVMGGRR